MNALMLQFYRLRNRFGLSGLAALGLLLAGLLVYVLDILPMQAQIAEQQQLLQQQQAQPEVNEPLLKPDAQALSDFYGQFPLLTSLPDALSKIDAQARAQHIELARADFKLSEDQQGDLMRYEISLPLKASYQQLRGFIERLSRVMPTMGLSDISLKREGIDNELVDARLNFVLYLRQP